MKTGDRVKFRFNSKAWRSHGLNPDAQGVVIDIYRTAIRNDIKADVRFGSAMEAERGIDVGELETIHEPPARYDQSRQKPTGRPGLRPKG